MLLGGPNGANWVDGTSKTLTITAVLCLLLFTRVQSHGQQHLLLYLPALCAALALGLEALPARRPVRAGAWVLALCMLGSSLLPRPQPASPQEIGSLAPLPTFTYAPPQRSDLAQLVALRVYVDGLSAQEPKTAAVIASSFVFNSSILDNTLRSAGIPQPRSAGPLHRPAGGRGRPRHGIQ